MTWQPIETAPRDGKPVDLWAKRWVPADDSWIYMRCPDCRWMKGDRMANRDAYWLNLYHGWFATHWMPLPEPPS